MSRRNFIPLRRALLRWYRRTARPFPWRRTRDPYRVLVSEVMLQQTQASRVVPYYTKFLRRFPTARALASASPGSVLRTWQGLGYNMRALRLHATVTYLVRHRKGAFPTTVDELLELPGIGPYTARAVSVFAFNRTEAVLDTNVRRVLHRLYPRLPDRADFQSLADTFLARKDAYDWNQAVMELGATVCTPAEPACYQCPIAAFCPSEGRASRIDAKKATQERRYRGYPRRIYRGKIVALLHTSGRRKTLDESEISKQVFSKGMPGDQPFIRAVLLSLQKDGLLQLRRSSPKWSVSPVR